MPIPISYDIHIAISKCLKSQKQESKEHLEFMLPPKEEAITLSKTNTRGNFLDMNIPFQISNQQEKITLPLQTSTKPEPIPLPCTNCEHMKANHSLSNIWKVSCGVEEKGTGCQMTTTKDPAQHSRPENRNHGVRRISNKSNAAIIYGVGSYSQK